MFIIELKLGIIKILGKIAEILGKPQPFKSPNSLL